MFTFSGTTSKFWSDLGDFQISILALFGVYFDSEIVFVTKFSLLFRFTLAIL